jgi:hypothetical protein
MEPMKKPMARQTAAVVYGIDECETSAAIALAM